MWISFLAHIYITTLFPLFMLIDYILIPLTFVVLFVASSVDLRIKEVPDWLSYGFIMAALGVRAIFSFDEGITLFVGGLLGLAVCFAIACFLYYTSQWGGGDSKLLMGMGAAIGVDLPLQASSLNLLWFFLSLLFLGAAYGLIWMGYLAMTQRTSFREQWILSWKHSRKWQITAAITTLALLLAALASPFFWPTVLFPGMVFLVFTFVNAVERSCFYRYKLPKNIAEGDWLAEDVTVNGKILLAPKTLEKEDITTLKSLEVEKKIKKVFIKEGIPFTPAFLFAYAWLLAGSWWAGWLIKVIFG